MKSPLLNKPKNFNQAHQILVLRIQSIKRKNDQYQRLTGEQIDPGMAQEILDEKHIMDKEIEDTKRFIQEFEQTLREQQQKNKLKETKKQYEKQTMRYKLISEALMEKSTIRAEMRDSVRRNSTNRNSIQRNRNSRDDQSHIVKPQRQSTHVFKQQQIDMDFEQNLIRGRKKDLIENSQKLQKIYGVVQDMAKQVSSQGQKVDEIDVNMFKAQENVEAANQQLTKGQIQQKKAKKKYIIMAFVIIFLVICVIGVVLLLPHQ